MKEYVVLHKDAVTGLLHGNAGIFRVLVDEETSGAKFFSLLINTMKAGVEGAAHRHDKNEHCRYILSGRGTMYIEGTPYEIRPEMAVFVPPNAIHRIDVVPDEDLTYVLIYAPART